MTFKGTLIVITLFSLPWFSSGELRWCPANTTNADDIWVRYQDSEQTCVRCSNQSATLVTNEEVERYECCQDSLVAVGDCNSTSGSPDGVCSAGLTCDGVKQCVNGSDEIGCRDCVGTDSFSCNSHADAAPCISTNKVCNGRKDCEFGLDEVNCQWHDGWCDGFLCAKPHERCIPTSQVCDGTKQCLDGSDEYNCHYCLQQFRCSVFEREESALQAGTSTTTAQCIGFFRVCDGRADCANRLDESNCYRWLEWALWSECNPPVACERSRHRICVDNAGGEVQPSLCYNVEDYHVSNGDPSVETHTEICPPCIPPPPNTTTTTEQSLPTISIGKIRTPYMASTNDVVTSEFTTSTEERFTTFSNSNSFSSSNLLITSTNVESTWAPFEDTTFALETVFVATSNGEATSNRNEVTESGSILTTSLLTNNTSETIIINSAQRVGPTSLKGSTTGNPTKIPSTTRSFTNDRNQFATESTFSPVTSPGGQADIAGISFTLILVIAIAAGVVLLMIIIALVFCLTDRKRKTGKWYPRRRRYHDRNFRVPRMYDDVMLDDLRDGRLPTSQNSISIHKPPISSFSQATILSGMDSGIDDERSTTSSLGTFTRHTRRLSRTGHIPTHSLSVQPSLEMRMGYNEELPEPPPDLSNSPA